MQHIRVRMLAMSLNNVLSGQPLNSRSLGQVWNEAHAAALQTYCLHSAQQNLSVPDTHIHNRCRYHCSCCGGCLKGGPRLRFSKEEDEEDPGCPGYGANTEGGLPWGLSFSLLFQGVWWLFLPPNPGAYHVPTRNLEHSELGEPRSSNWEFEMEMLADFFPHPGNLSPSNSSSSF